MKQAISDFINSGMLLVKPIDAFFTQEYLAFVESCYERLEAFHSNTPATDSLKSAYISLMKIVTNPKIENINLLIFCATYIASKYLYQKQEEELIKPNQRWHSDNYHIISFTLNGVMVSDAFIETNLKKYLSDKYMDYTKKIAYVPPYIKPTKFFGHSIEFPKLDSNEGVEFTQALQGIFKSPSKSRKLPIVIEDSQYEVRQQYKSPQVKRMKMDVNSISPSLASALHRTSIGFEKPKIINHPLEKPHLGDMNFLMRFKDINTETEKKVETKTPKSNRQNIVEQHNLTYPPKEYFQKNAKVDGFFKNFLELKYVLEQRKETMSAIKSYKQRVPYVPSYTPYLQLDSPTFQNKQFEQRSSIALQSPSPDLEKQQISKFEIQAATTKATFNPSSMMNFYKDKPHTQTFHSTSYSYVNKQKEYKQKFDRFLSNESSPDKNINHLQGQLLKKQHFFKRGLVNLKK